ncbi:hypothetical protein HanPI659440_Chr09g0315851 [Helianthus annuus]|nr:hypothetical protein HanPI659440_Chr09g0315851 [Helianthus annuus]
MENKSQLNIIIYETSNLIKGLHVSYCIYLVNMIWHMQCTNVDDVVVLKLLQLEGFRLVKNSKDIFMSFRYTTVYIEIL